MSDEEGGNGKDDLQHFVIRREVVVVDTRQPSSILIGLYAFVKNDLESHERDPRLTMIDREKQAIMIDDLIGSLWGGGGGGNETTYLND